MYPAGIASLLDEENLAAAREYECPCGNKCLSRVSFIEVYEFRKECARYTLASLRLVAHACTSTDPAALATRATISSLTHNFKCAHVRFNVCLCMCAQARSRQGRASRQGCAGALLNSDKGLRWVYGGVPLRLLLRGICLGKWVFQFNSCACACIGDEALALAP